MSSIADGGRGLSCDVKEINVHRPQGLAITFMDISAPMNVISPRGAEATG
ncbi:hypothetical protein ABZ499_09470 [Streptomyces sp. NPDC019990]